MELLLLQKRVAPQGYLLTTHTYRLPKGPLCIERMKLAGLEEICFPREAVERE